MALAIDVQSLEYNFAPLPGTSPSTAALCGVSFRLAPGSRCLLVGANGAGKSTLLWLLAGKKMIPRSQCIVLGSHPFHDTALQRRIGYLGGNWARDLPGAGYGCQYQADFPVRQMLQGLPAAERNPARVQRLIEVLDVDLDWRMHRVSDGQRRRVQLLLGLLPECELYLLDEITVDLDVVARHNLLCFLHAESIDPLRQVCIIYATHIFDGLTDWASHVLHLDRGRTAYFGDASLAIREVGSHVSACPKASAPDESTAPDIVKGAESFGLNFYAWTPLAFLVYRWILQASHKGHQQNPVLLTARDAAEPLSASAQLLAATEARNARFWPPSA